VTCGRASSAGAVRWLGTLARGAAVLLGTVLLVLLVPSEVWAGVTSYTSSSGATVTVTDPTDGAGRASDGKVAITWSRPTSANATRVCTVAANGDVWSGSLGGSSAGSAYTYTVPSGTSTVTAGNPVVEWRVWQSYGTTSSWSCPADGGSLAATSANLHAFSAPSPYEELGRRYSSDPSTCTDWWSAARASADGTTLVVRFVWEGASKPVGGWRVESDDGTVYYGKVPRGVISGTLRTQGADLATSATPSVVRVESAADSTCYLNVNVSTSADDVLVDDGSVECSFGDVACYFRASLNWAFVPESATLDQFGSMWDDMGTKIPFVYVAGGFELLSFNVAESGAGWSYDGVMRLPCAMGDSLNICETGTYTYVLPPGDAILTWMRDYREALSVFMWLLLVVPLGLFVWRRLFPVVGSGAQ